MLITRKKEIPTHWIFYAQIPFVMAVAANMITGAPFIYSMKKFIDNPAAITFLLSVEVFITVLGGPFASWLSDRIWTRYGRRKPFLIIADLGKLLVFPLIPLAPNIFVLIGLKWAYGILHDIGNPKTALTMEIVPAKQRGRGSGFFNLQLQVVNLVFWGIVIGRFDDVYFTGPLAGLDGLPGEALLYFAGSLMFVFVLGFNMLGIKEIRPPDARRLRDELKPGQNLVNLFLTSFFKEVLHKSLLPLYLLLVVGTMTTVGLGALGPLLYTDQWGYSLQQLGTNVAIGAVLGMGIALFAGYAADATSKLKVYTWALVGGLAAKILWTVFVYNKPGMRPELWEIVAFGQLTHTFGLIAATVSFPLILEYVTRNQLGTANAGIGLFDGIIRNGFSMMIGFYILWWSIFFLPQAGDRVELVFAEPRDRAFVQAVLAEHDLDRPGIDLKPLHRPGTGAPVSPRWEIRRSREEAGALHKERKDLANEIGKLNTRLQSPLLKPKRAQALTARLAGAKQRMAVIDQSLQASAADFRSQMEGAFAPWLYAHGGQILDARREGDYLLLEIEVVEKVTPEIAAALEINFDSADLAQVRGAENGETISDLSVAPLVGPVNGLRIRLRRDRNFIVLERALMDAGISPEEAFGTASELITILRGAFRQDDNGFMLADAQPGAGPDQPDLILRITVPGAPLADAHALDEALMFSRRIALAETNGSFPNISTSITWAAPPGTGDAKPDPVLMERLGTLLPDADPYLQHSILGLYERMVSVAASAPTFLTVARPLVAAEPADRRYDYFFSVQFFMIFTDLIGLLVIGLIVWLEKRGAISRVGAHEDDNR